MEIKITQRIQVPRTPKFMRTGSDTTIDIRDIPDEELSLIADAWKAALLADAQQRRERTND